VISVCCAAQPGGFQEDSNRQVIFIFDRKIYIHFLKRLKRLGHEIDWNLTCMDTGQIGLVRVAIGFLTFQMLLLQKKLFVIFLAVNSNTAPLDYIISLYLAEILLLLIG